MYTYMYMYRCIDIYIYIGGEREIKVWVLKFKV